MAIKSPYSVINLCFSHRQNISKYTLFSTVSIHYQNVTTTEPHQHSSARQVRHTLSQIGMPINREYIDLLHD